MKSIIEYLGEEGLLKALTLIKTALAGKQDKMKEITAEETRQMWNEVVSANSNLITISFNDTTDESNKEILRPLIMQGENKIYPVDGTITVDKTLSIDLCTELLQDIPNSGPRVTDNIIYYADNDVVAGIYDVSRGVTGHIQVYNTINDLSNVTSINFRFNGSI